MKKILPTTAGFVLMLSGCSAIQGTVGFAADVVTFPVDVVTDVIGAETSKDREIKRAEQNRDSAIAASREEAIRLQRGRDLAVAASRREALQAQQDRDLAVAFSNQEAARLQRIRNSEIAASRQEIAQLQKDRDLAIASSVRDSNRAQSSLQELNQMISRVNELEAQASFLENSLSTQRMSFQQEQSQRIALQQVYSSLNTAVERAEVRAKRIGVDLDISPNGSRVRRIN